MKKCKQCGAENQDSARFCGNCREAFVKVPIKYVLPRFTKVHLAMVLAVVGGALAYYFLFQGNIDYAKAAASLSVNDINTRADAAYKAKDYSASRNWYEQSAAKGDFAAQNWVGWFYQNGLGVKIDNEQAVSWYMKAASRGYAPSETNVGWCYQNGLGVTTDLQQAIEWYQKAVAQANDSAEINIGYLYENGIGVPRDYGEARRYYKMAVDHGSQEAKKDLDMLEAKQVNLNALMQHPVGQ